MKDASVIGYYGVANSGDEAFRDAFKALLPDVGFSFYHRKVSAEEVAGTRLVLGAGDAINDYFLKFLPPDVPFDIIGAALPYLDGSLELLKPLKDRIRNCYFRHQIDVKVACAAGFEARYTPDIVFAIDPAETVPELRFNRRYSKLAVLFLSSNTATTPEFILHNFHYTEYLKHELARVLDFIGAYNDILFVPLSWSHWEPDSRMSLDVFVKVKRRSHINMHVLDRELSPREIVALMRGANVAISMKFHGIVYSMLAGVPCINIARTKKAHTLMQEIGLGDLDTPDMTFEASRFIKTIKLAEEPATRRRVADIVAKQRLELKQVGSELRERWDDVT